MSVSRVVLIDVLLAGTLRRRAEGGRTADQLVGDVMGAVQTIPQGRRWRTALTPRLRLLPVVLGTGLSLTVVGAALIAGGAERTARPESATVVFAQADGDGTGPEVSSVTISAAPIDGGDPMRLVDVPGDRWAPHEGSSNFDPRNEQLVGPAVRLSPDGTRIAFRLFNDAPGIYVMDRDGGDLHRLVDLPMDREDGMGFSAALDWSPDGTRIAYTYPYTFMRSSLYVVDTLDGNVINLLEGNVKRRVSRTVAWSPDGANIAFVRTNGAALPTANELFVMNADGTGERQLATGSEPYPQVQAVAWSPDGASIAFVQDMGDPTQAAPERGVLRVVNVDGSGLRTVSGPWQNNGCCLWVSVDLPLAWSPDGTSIALIREVRRGADLRDWVTLVAADGSGERALIEGSYFDWSHDGSRLVVSDAGGPVMLSSDIPHTVPSSIWVIDADGTGKRRVADGEYAAWAPATYP